MISIEEAQAAILAATIPLPLQEVPLLQALNRICGDDHIAPWSIPFADNSAMDGYAYKHADLSGDTLRVVGFLPAGEVYDKPVGAGETVKIMTGALVPADCDTVVPFEDVDESDTQIRFRDPVKAGANVRRKGEDIREGEVVIPAGTRLRPQEIGMLASMGRTSVSVRSRARVAVLATGDELLEPGTPPQPGKIINSNSLSLGAQVLDAGAEPLLLGIARDSLEETCDAIRRGMEADMLVISGGVSTGDRDFVKTALEQLGGKVLFWKVNMKPGKPLAFALLDGKPVFALPGNPVAAMVSFELFVRPAILKAMGHRRLFRPLIPARLQEPVANKGNRPHFVRGLVACGDGGSVVSTTGNQSSGRLSSLVQGNGLIRLAPESARQAGETVEVMLLDHAFGMREQ